MSWKSFHGIFALIFILLHVPCDAEVLTHCTCGRSNQNFVSRIVGGRETSRHEYPWVVGIVSEDGMINCGGSIISTRHVLSAGHCVFHDPSDPIGQRFIIVGAHDMNAIEPEMIYGISKAIMHPAWTAYDSWDSQDMAIYVTDRPIHFGKHVIPICLPSSPKDYAGARALVAGWGRTQDGGLTSKYLQDIRINVLDEDTCQSHPSIGQMFEPQSMMCAFAPMKDACQGDSGGPLFLQTDRNRFEQIGVVSFGLGCGTDNPGIYTKVSTSLNWIRSVIANADVCQDTE